MLTGHNLIYFAPEKWDGLWRNRQQLMSLFARQNRVLFVEARPYLRPTLAGFRRGDLGLPDLRRPSVRQISENLFVFRYPVWAPISGRFPVNRLTRIIRRLSIQNVLRQLQMSHPIVWFSRPDMVELVNEIPPARLLLYHVVDEYTTYDGQSPAGRRRIREQEKQMMALVDAVVVVSKKLYQAKHPFNLNTYLVPNGVDYEAYHAALADPHLPDDLQRIKPPRLGYIGLISDKLNFNMLKELARGNPEWSLVLLGEARVSLQAETWQALRELPNVHHLGPVEISQVPYYVKGFQVGLMPYLQNRHAEHISPLKLYDYLAAGLPVASMDIPAAREFSQHIHLADGPQDFAQTVRAALADTAPDPRRTRKLVASQHTWEARVEQLSDLIQAQLTAKDLPGPRQDLSDMSPKRRRILYVEAPALVGGSVISLYELVRGLDTSSYEPIVLFHKPNPYRERFRALGVKVITLSEHAPTAMPPAGGPRRDIAASLSRYGNWLADGYRAAKEIYLLARRDLPLALRVARLIKEEAIDLVHHNNSLPGNRATIIAARLAGVPQVCHVRMLHRFSYLERCLASFVDTFIYISKAVEQLYCNLGIPGSKGEVVYDPFNVEAFKQVNHTAELRAEFGLTSQDRLISNVGRIDWWKGLDYLLQAMAEVVASQPNVKALIVGAPDPTPLSQAYYQKLVRMVMDLQLSGYVIFTGFRTDIPRIMAASDIVVHSASEPEPLGRVIVEAMAAGRPVIATAAGGVLDIVEDGVTGLLVPPKNAALMAKAIQQFLQNREQAKAIGQRAQQRAQERFSVEQHVTAIQRVYEKILAS